MSSDMKRLYTEDEFKLHFQEFQHELQLLSTLRDQQVQDIHKRDDEIGKLLVEKKLLEEEKSVLKSQVSTITAKSIEALEFQSAMFAMCESLQQKLRAKTEQEQQSIVQMEYLMQKTKTSNDYAADSRKNLEIMQREVNKLNALLAQERDKNHELVTQLNQAYEERRDY